MEVAHEALIRHWKRSQGWVNNARGFLTWRKRLEPFVDEWRKLNRDRTALLRGGLLAEAQRWLTERRQDLDAPEQEFIEASIREKKREERSGSPEEAVPRRTLRRRGRGSVPGNGLGGVAWWQWGIAGRERSQREQERNHCKANEIRPSATSPRAWLPSRRLFGDKLPQRSVLLASESVNIYQTQ